MGEFGGAVGTLASLGKQGLPVQQGVMETLGLTQPPIAWHTVRDTIAEVGCFLGILLSLIHIWVSPRMLKAISGH